jgi:hypothetical protein
MPTTYGSVCSGIEAATLAWWSAGSAGAFCTRSQPARTDDHSDQADDGGNQVYQFYQAFHMSFLGRLEAEEWFRSLQVPN